MSIVRWPNRMALKLFIHAEMNCLGQLNLTAIYIMITCTLLFRWLQASQLWTHMHQYGRNGGHMSLQSRLLTQLRWQELCRWDTYLNYICYLYNVILTSHFPTNMPNPSSVPLNETTQWKNYSKLIYGNDLNSVSLCLGNGISSWLMLISYIWTGSGPMVQH